MSTRSVRCGRHHRRLQDGPSALAAAVPVMRPVSVAPTPPEASREWSLAVCVLPHPLLSVLSLRPTHVASRDSRSFPFEAESHPAEGGHAGRRERRGCGPGCVDTSSRRCSPCPCVCPRGASPGPPRPPRLCPQQPHITAPQWRTGFQGLPVFVTPALLRSFCRHPGGCEVVSPCGFDPDSQLGPRGGLS